MSLQGLMSGADCAVAANPLSQVLKHSEGDRSLQQDRIAGPSSSRLQYLPSSSTQAAAEQDMAMARQFFEANGQGPAIPPPMAQLPQMPRFDMARPMPGISQPNVNLSHVWKDSQSPQFQMPSSVPQQSSWAGEFTPQVAGPAHATESHAAIPQQPMVGSSFQSGFSMPQYSMGMPYRQDAYLSGINESFGNMAVQDKGKAKMKDSDFEAAFAQFEPAQDSASKAAEPGAAEMESTSEQIAREALDQAHAESFSDGLSFQEIWNQMQNSDLPPPKEDMAKWEAQFNQMMNGQRDDLDYDYGAGMSEAWQSGVGEWRHTSDDSIKFDHEGLPMLEPYAFEQNNRYLDPSTSSQSPLADAKALLEQNGSLSEAALLLEAAIQKGDLGEGGYEAWILLGEVRNMDEREDAGMKALTEGVRLAEAAGAAGAGMVSLAISYTNESFDRASNTMLIRWLRARYPERPIPQATLDSLTQSQWHSHDLVTEAFLDLAREQHSQGVIDPDVQIALGVLFYTNGNYDRAKDCFETALSARPKDYLLWNRLGSALSNGNKPEESLGAYREALSLRPTYTRAIYNVGVACLNIGADKEAAEHFLSALALQESTGGEKSEQLWTTLRRALRTLGRDDLVEITKSNPNVEVFRKEGFEF
ncbi:TPR-like protein [Dentipellis sp. KUC8613]|nr:TPR-like protein [Dentipellis sp. KUC8613]